MMRIDVLKQEYIFPVSEIEKESFSLPWSADAFNQELSSPVARYFVAIEDDIVVGYIGVHVILDEGYITNVAVKSTYRGRKISKSLVRSVIDYCIQKGCAFISLEVRKSNRTAIGLYENFGFKFAGVRKNYYSKPPEDGLIMTLTL